ncbi:MAG: SusC/RagA family TonB-linked outer membrane protein [Candidatus Cyclobacteriaceae bacterium M3_2C_046]
MEKNYPKIGMLFIAMFFLSVIQVYGQRTITGKVTAMEENEALPGVNVLVQNSSVGTVTDVNGNYRIELPAGSNALVFSYVGYTTEEVEVGNRSVVDVQLVPDIEQLSEVVVVGYGTQERGVVTGAVSSVKMDEVRSIPISNVEQALQGRVAGVTVTQTGGGTPGGAMQVNIRGIGSINAETPLYVIDGIPVQSGGQNADGYSFLNSLNPNDIESIDILKDASAAAIYGSRASGGVVLITTKRGKQGPVRVNFDAYYGSQSQGNFYDVLDADGYVNYLNELHSQPDGDIPTGFANGGRPSTANTDWQDALFDPAPIQNYNLGVSGGNQNALFSLGLEYFNQDGTMVGTGFERYSLRANSDFKIGKSIKLGQTLLLSRTDKDVFTGSGGREPQEHAIKQAPTVSVYDDSFLGGFGFPDTDEGQDAQNPVAIAMLNNNQQTRYRTWASLFGEWEIIKGLTYKLQLGLDFNYQDNFNYSPRYEQVRRLPSASSINVGRSQFFSPLVEQFLTYNNNFGKHNLSAMVGWSAQSFEFTNRGASGSQLPDGVINLVAATANINVSYDKNESALRSLFGRITYGFDDKYLLTANIRRDESSKLFRGNNPTGIFPSISAGWRISEEPFMQNVAFISDMKFRAGYGLLGNQTPLGNYPIDALLNPNYFYIFGNSIAQGITQVDLANADITWETTRQIDIGLDVGLFDNTLELNLDYYKRNTEDLIWRQQVAPSVGLGPPFVNAGEVQNTGIEAALTYRKVSGDFTFDISGNLTTINNEVVSLNQPDLIIRNGNPTDDLNNVSWTQAGQPIGTFYGYVSDGIFTDWDDVYNWAYINQAITDETNANGVPVFDADKRDAETAVNRTAPGDVRWVDVDGNGIINNDDQVPLGNPIPEMTLGLTFSGRYKGFDLQLFIQGAYGHELYNSAKRWLSDFRQNFNNGVAANSATAYRPNYTGSEPRLVRADPNRNILRSSDRYVFDGSYTRIKNLTIGYSFNQGVLDAINATKLRIYATSQNLATFTDYFGLEPDVGSLSTGTARDAGIDRLTYPQPTTFIMGVQVGF